MTEISYKLALGQSSSRGSVTVHENRLTLVGPNGSGKTQLLRALKDGFRDGHANTEIRLLSAGRLSPLEPFRSDEDGHRGRARYDLANFGSRNQGTHQLLSESVIGDFHALAQLPDLQVKVAARLKALFKRDVIIHWEDGKLKVSMANRETGRQYSSAEEASGLVQLIALLAALYDRRCQCLLIDEPEVSLHPQLQAFLLAEIKRVTGAGDKAVVVATHSPYMLSVESPLDLCSLVYCQGAGRPPIQVRAGAPELGDRRIPVLLATQGDVLKRALLSQRALLVEGASDEVIVGALNARLSLGVHESGADVLPIAGKGQLPVVLKVLRLFSAPPTALLDADALADSAELGGLYAETLANDLAVDAGHKSLKDQHKDLHNDFTHIVDSDWDRLRADCEKHRYFSRPSALDERKRRAALCFILSGDEASVRAVGVPKLLEVRRRYFALLETLRCAGCHVLCRGTIEDYFSQSPANQDSKIDLALREASAIAIESPDGIRTRCADVIGAIQAVAVAAEPSEAELLRQLLLSFASPIMAIVDERTTQPEVEAAMFKFGSDYRDLFDVILLRDELGPGVEFRMKSDLLRIEGFPLVLRPGQDLIARVKESIQDA